MVFAWALSTKIYFKYTYVSRYVPAIQGLACMIDRRRYRTARRSGLGVSLLASPLAIHAFFCRFIPYPPNLSFRLWVESNDRAVLFYLPQILMSFQCRYSYWLGFRIWKEVSGSNLIFCQVFEVVGSILIFYVFTKNTFSPSCIKVMQMFMQLVCLFDHFMWSLLQYHENYGPKIEFVLLILDLLLGGGCFTVAANGLSNAMSLALWLCFYPCSFRFSFIHFGSKGASPNIMLQIPLLVLWLPRRKVLVNGMIMSFVVVSS